MEKENLTPEQIETLINEVLIILNGLSYEEIDKLTYGIRLKAREKSILNIC